MESMFMTAVVSLLPVLGGYDGTRVSSVNRTRFLAPTATTKNAGAAGTPGYPSWSHPV